MTHTTRSHRSRLMFMVMAISSPLVAQESFPYPRVDVAVSYEVDPSWPKRPNDKLVVV